MEKQLSVWIDGELKEALIERARQENVPLKHLIEGILRQSMAHYRGEMIERQALPVIREVMRRELRKAFAHLLTTMREEVNPKMVDQMSSLTQQSADHLAALLSRHDAINRRLLYALLSHASGEAFAHDAYEQALQWSQVAPAGVGVLQLFPGFEGNNVQTRNVQAEGITKRNQMMNGHERKTKGLE